MGAGKNALGLAPRWKPISSLIIALLLALALAGPARADIAPPSVPPGSNISPQGETQVQMYAETVEIDIPDQPLAGEEGRSTRAHVRVDFTMRNHGAADEQMRVRFPLDNIHERSSDTFNPDYAPLIEDFSATVGGQLVATTIITEPMTYGDELPWATFDVTFPAGQDLHVVVAYSLQPADMDDGDKYGGFSYILETGAGWHGTIGTADVIVRLPVEASDETVLPWNPGMGYDLPAGADVVGREIRWHFEDLEPTQEDNIAFCVLSPELWEDVEAARAEAEANPHDPAALVALADAYQAAMPYPHGAPDLDSTWLKLGEQAYRQALDLHPGSIELHEGYVERLLAHAYIHGGYMTHESPEILRARDAALALLALDPRNEAALAALEELRTRIFEPDKLVVALPPTWTATPLPSATLEPTLTSLPTPTTTEQPARPATTTAEAVAARPATSAPRRPTVAEAGVRQPTTVTPSLEAQQATAKSAVRVALLSGMGLALLLGLGGLVGMARRRRA